MTRKTVARKGLVEATSDGVEVNENPRKAITNKEKRKTRPYVDDEVVNRPHSGNPGKTNSKKGKTLEVSKIAADAVVEEDGGDIEEDVEKEMAVVTNNVTTDMVATTTIVGGPSRKGRNGGWKRDGKMVISADGNVIKTSKKVADTYGSPGGLFKLIKSMTEEQKRSVEDIGFGGLLELKASGFYHVMIDWLMECYDPDSRMFMIDEAKYFVMTRDDVYDAFMLPCGSDGNEVLRTSAKKKNNPDLELMETWRHRFGLEAGEEMSNDKLVDVILEMSEGGHDFKQLFVLYVMSSFLAPTCHNHVDLRLIKAVENVDYIINQDWCLYVLEKLGEAVNNWKVKQTKNVGGCMMLLQLLYFHRLIWRGDRAKSTIPLVKHWTYEAIKSRVEEERVAALKNNNQYGKGDWDKKTYPMSRYLPKVIYRLPTVGNDPTSNAIKKGTITFDLPSDLLDDEEIREKYADPRLANWMRTKRDLEIVSRLHDIRTKELENQPANVIPIGEKGKGIEEVEGEFTQALKDPEFLASYLALGKRIDEMVQMTLIEPPSFDLGIDLSGINDTNRQEPLQKKSVH
ncbi:hypothetical protein KSS87_000363 [Heliosperma pusillum]|nr:hypothetical protein KSS87_000363 [Heliosperma pusillum]